LHIPLIVLPVPAAGLDSHAAGIYGLRKAGLQGSKGDGSSGFFEKGSKRTVPLLPLLPVTFPGGRGLP
jgi:hypothetical protein